MQDKGVKYEEKEAQGQGKEVEERKYNSSSSNISTDESKSNIDKLASLMKSRDKASASGSPSKLSKPSLSSVKDEDDKAEVESKSEISKEDRKKRN